jgi:hypothetical protein
LSQAWATTLQGGFEGDFIRVHSPQHTELSVEQRGVMTTISSKDFIDIRALRANPVQGLLIRWRDPSKNIIGGESGYTKDTKNKDLEFAFSPLVDASYAPGQ